MSDHIARILLTSNFRKFLIELIEALTLDFRRFLIEFIENSSVSKYMYFTVLQKISINKIPYVIQLKIFSSENTSDILATRSPSVLLSHRHEYSCDVSSYMYHPIWQYSRTHNSLFLLLAL